MRKIRKGKASPERINDMDYESLYSTATTALNSQLEITVKLQEQIIRLEDENKRFREEDGWKDIVHCQTNKIILLDERIKNLETALESIWPFIEEDFPKGTGDNHGTCATDSYVLAARQIEQVLKGK